MRKSTLRCATTCLYPLLFGFSHAMHTLILVSRAGTNLLGEHALRNGRNSGSAYVELYLTKRRGGEGRRSAKVLCGTCLKGSEQEAGMTQGGAGEEGAEKIFTLRETRKRHIYVYIYIYLFTYFDMSQIHRHSNDISV